MCIVLQCKMQLLIPDCPNSFIKTLIAHRVRIPQRPPSMEWNSGTCKECNMRSAAFAVIMLLFAISLSRFGMAAESTIAIDFENLSRGEIVYEQYKSQGVVIRGANWSDGPDYAVVFDSTNI